MKHHGAWRSAAAAAVWTLLTCGVLMAEDQAGGETAIRAMTFNIRYNNPGDGENAWPHRRDWVAEIIREREADIVGCQEALRGQIADLAERLPGYAWYGVGRDDGAERGEFVPVFYRRDRFELLDKDAFWLSETPDEPGSRSWDSSLPRVTTVLRLKDRRSGAVLLVVNTHFDHRGSEARAASARLILTEIARRGRNNEAVVFMGDLNCKPDSVPYQVLTADEDDQPVTLRDARSASRTEPAGPESTWNGFAAVAQDTRIDYVFVAGPVRVESYEAIDEMRDGRFPSDHLPVIVRLDVSQSDTRD